MADKSHKARKNNCYYRGMSYPEGSKVGNDTYNIMVCWHGIWRDPDEVFEDSDIPLAHFYH